MKPFDCRLSSPFSSSVARPPPTLQNQPFQQIVLDASTLSPLLAGPPQPRPICLFTSTTTFSPSDSSSVCSTPTTSEQMMLRTRLRRPLRECRILNFIRSCVAFAHDSPPHSDRSKSLTMPQALLAASVMVGSCSARALTSDLRTEIFAAPTGILWCCRCRCPDSFHHQERHHIEFGLPE